MNEPVRRWWLPRAALTALAAFAASAALGGCEKLFHDMYDQPRAKPLRPSPVVPGGSFSRSLPDDSLPMAEGALAGTSSARLGQESTRQANAATAADRIPYPLDAALLERGRERYSIYCLPCHGPLGDGDGLVVRHGFPAPPSYHSDRLRSAPDRHFFDVMTNGYGVMYPYRDRVEPADRWAIVAYIRALQLSRHAEVARLPPGLRHQLESAAARAPAEGTKR